MYKIFKDIFLNIPNDRLKLIMRKFLDTEDEAELIASLHSDDLKIRYINKKNSKPYNSYANWYLEIVILSIKSEEKKIEALKLVYDEYIRARIIREFKNDKIKIDFLSDFSDERDKIEIIISLEDDERKIEQLEKIKNETIRADGIISLKDDKLKLQQLKKLTEEEAKVSVIKSIQNDELKIQQLKKITDEDDKEFIIRSIQDDKLKIQQLEGLTNKKAQVRVIVSLKNDKLKIIELDKLTDERAKVYVMKSIQNDELKIQQLGQLTDEKAKVSVIKTILNDELKIQELEKLSKLSYKVEVIKSIWDSDLKNQMFDKLFAELIGKKLKKTQHEGYKYQKQRKWLVTRKNLRKSLLNEHRKYTQIGLDEKMTIGMEIESEGMLSNYLRRLYKVLTTKTGLRTRGWNTKADGSLWDGVEIVSPILRDNKKDVEDIYIICSMLQKLKQHTSERCGGHIHIGANYLTSKEAYVNLFEIWGNAEKIIYKISNEKEELPRIKMKEYASPISLKLSRAIEKGTINLKSEEELDEFISELQSVQEDRYSGLNLLNINNRKKTIINKILKSLRINNKKNTIEFRISNGTINPDVWIENARLYGRMVQISQRLAEIEKQPEKSREDKKLLELKELLKEEMPEHKKMEVLLELLFSKEEREVYRERYISNTRILEQTSNEENPFEQTEFGLVDFKKKHSTDEFRKIAVNERVGATNNILIETEQGACLENDNIKDR